LKPAELKVHLLCLGLKPEVEIDKGRKGGAGPAGGRYLLLPGNLCVNAAFWGKFVESSPFTLVEHRGKIIIRRGNEEISEAKVVPYPEFYKMKTSDGVPMWKVALLHGTDCLATTVLQTCVYWRHGKACKFCGIELSYRAGRTILLKRPKQFREVVDAAVREGVCKHITLTIGTTGSPDRGALILKEIVQEVKSHHDIPIHVQLEPPDDDKFLEELADAGADTIGIHVETFDRKVFKEVCPGKARIDIDRYFEAWRTCIDLFGEYQVSTFVIAGIGENDESILRGAEEVARMGVIPYLVPLRPIIGTPFENRAPPTPERMIKLYRVLAETLKSYGVDPRKNRAGCVRCGACSAITEAYTGFL